MTDCKMTDEELSQILIGLEDDRFDRSGVEHNLQPWSDEEAAIVLDAIDAAVATSLASADTQGVGSSTACTRSSHRIELIDALERALAVSHSFGDPDTTSAIQEVLAHVHSEPALVRRNSP